MASLDLPGLGLPALTLTPRKRKVKSPELEYDPAESKSLLGRVGSGVLSGIEAAGNLLDIPGATVRNVLAGENPLAPITNPLSQEGRVTGRDLLRRGGLVGPDDNWMNWVAGLGAEIALSPETYLTLGGSALTKGGRIAKAAGVLDDVAKIAGKGPRVAGMTTTLGELAAKSSPEAQKALGAAAKGLGTDLAKESSKPLRGLVGIGMPFQDPSFVLGTGKTAQKIAGALDVAGAAAKGSYAGRTIRRFFDPSVMGKLDPIEQSIAETVYKARPAALRAARETFVNTLNEYREVHKAFEDAFGATIGAGKGTTEARDATLKAFDDIVQFTGEVGSDANKAFGQLGAGLTPNPEMIQKVSGLAQSMKKANLLIHAAIEDKGGWTGWIPNHMARYMKQLAGKDVQGSRLLPTLHAGMQARTPAIRDIPKAIVNKISSDPTVRGDAAEVVKKYGQWLDPKFEGGVDAHAKAVADWTAGLPKDAGETFTGSSIDDFAHYQKGAHLVDRSLDAIQQVVKENLIDSGGVMVETAFKEAGMNPAYAMNYLAKATGMTIDQVASKQIPADVAAAIKGTLEITKTPAWQNQIASAVDTFNGLFKRAVTLPFPSFHTRNFISGQYNNLASGFVNSPNDIAAYKNAFTKALRLFKGKDQKLIDELYIAGVLHPERLAQDVELPSSLNKATSNMLWSQPVSSPLDVPGAFGEARAAAKATRSVVPEALRTGYGTVQNIGARAAQATEFMNRVPMYLYLREKGWDISAAVQKVDDLQVNYDALTPFEKSFMRRIAPFYGWQRRMAPVILGTLAERPGGHMAQTLRAINRGRGPDEVTPDYVAETASIPLGETPTGDKSYLTGFGLPLEAPFQYAGGGIRGAGLEALSQMTPLVKGPLEFAAGQTFFQKGPEGGRSLADLDPTIGRTLANIGNLTGLRESKAPVRFPFSDVVEAVASNSPATRLGTTARQLTDTRTDLLTRAFNLGTGVRIATISPASQDAVIRERAQQAERRLGGKTFIKSYIPADVLAAMSPAEKQDAMRLQALLNTLSARTKERKKATSQ